MYNLNEIVNKVHCADCLEFLRDMPSACIPLIVTSPPYFAFQEYENLVGYADYPAFMQGLLDRFRECCRVLIPGGRLVINIDDKHGGITTHKESCCYPTHASLIQGILSSNDIIYKGNIFWDKGARGGHATGGASHMLGSYPYPSEIPIITNYEYILVFKKLGKRVIVDKSTSRLTYDDFKTAIGIWKIAAEKKRDDHPCPFPIEIPGRIIKLFSFVGDVVLDPFIGSGTTALAARKLDRKFLGIDLSPEYCAFAQERVASLPKTFLDLLK